MMRIKIIFSTASFQKIFRLQVDNEVKYFSVAVEK